MALPVSLCEEAAVKDRRLRGHTLASCSPETLRS